MIPRSNAAFTFFISRITTTISPTKASKAQIPAVCQVPEKLTTVTSVESLFTTICAFCNPINATKRPIPAPTPFFNAIGIALKIASLTLVSERIINIIPSTNTARSAILHEYPIVPHTV